MRDLEIDFKIPKELNLKDVEVLLEDALIIVKQNEK